MSKRSKSKEVKPSNTWKCLSCEGDPTFEHKEMMAHLSEIHGIDTKTAKGTQRMLMHLDGDTWFEWQYEWTIGEVKAIQHTIQPRSKNDPMRYC